MVADIQARSAAEDAAAILAQLRARIEIQLARALPDRPASPETLAAAMRYAVLGGGKRLRPLLAHASGLSLGAASERLDAAAVAVELIHAYSLVHDDLPAMDDDALRRGRPTCHVVHGEGMAILAGDALQALAFEHLAKAALPATIRVEMLATLGQACGALGMAGGQALDLAATGRRITVSELERLHACKTGALIQASVMLGAQAAGYGADPLVMPALQRYGQCIGLAFQIQDDVLDVEGHSAQLGKTAGKDALQDKPTFPALLGLEASKQRARALVDEAIEALATLPAPAPLLVALARSCVERVS